METKLHIFTVLLKLGALKSNSISQFEKYQVQRYFKPFKSIFKQISRGEHFFFSFRSSNLEKQSEVQRLVRVSYKDVFSFLRFVVMEITFSFFGNALCKSYHNITKRREGCDYVLFSSFQLFFFSFLIWCYLFFESFSITGNFLILLQFSVLKVFKVPLEPVALL